MIEFGSTKNVTRKFSSNQPSLQSLTALTAGLLTETSTDACSAEDYVEVGYWSTIEISIGIVCACMPAIRALLSHVFPFIFGGTRSGSSGAVSPYPFRSDKSAQTGGKSGNSAGSSGGNIIKSKNSGKYGKYSPTEITVQNEWAVVENQANRSDVELVAMEKKSPFGMPETAYVSSKPPDSDQWSDESRQTTNLPIQGRQSRLF